MPTLKCEQCSETITIEHVDSRLPGTWRELSSMDATHTEELITVGCHAAARPARSNVTVAIPRRLYFCSTRHQAEWLADAIDRHIDYCADEDRNSMSAAEYERQMRS